MSRLPPEIGKLNGEAVYLDDDGLYIEKDNFYLKEMNNVEIASFVHQQLNQKELHGEPIKLLDVKIDMI